MKNNVLFYGILIMVVIFIFPDLAYGNIPAQERAALIALYNSTDGDNWKDNSGWKTPPLHTDGFAMPGTETGWYGVMGWSGRDSIAEVRLNDNNLRGVIPPELGNLSQLNELNLNDNQLTGNIPPELGNLKILIFLRLMGNQLSGSIPPELGNMSNLNYLFLTGNQLSGNIPPELGNLKNLVNLSLNENQLTGGIPPGLGNITGLSHLYLKDNQLTGNIPPELGNITGLRYLYLNGNQLTGGIPPELRRITGLRYLYLNDNQLTGSIPVELANSGNLRILDLSHNQLTGNIPPEFGDSAGLTYLHLAGNRLTGEIPSTFTNFDVLNRYIDLDIMYNGVYTENSDLRLFLNEINRGWEDTQTIAPEDISALTLSTSSIRISWTPILYQEDTGGYEVYYSTAPGGPWTYSGITPDKSASSYTINGLNKGTAYYFTVKTRTAPHADNQNTITSEPGKEVSAVTDAVVYTCKLSIRSEPQSGLAVAVTPADNNGQSDGITNFTRVYSKGTTITLTAPALFRGNDFLKWTVDGMDSWNRQLELPVYDNHEITAFYGKYVEVTVTTTEDHVPGSLRYALIDANSRDKDTTILLPAGTYLLSGAEIEDRNLGGDLDIDTGQRITIRGEGAGKTIIDGGLLDRVLHVINGEVSVSGVTFQNGVTRDGVCGDVNESNGEDGGGIYNSGILNLTGCWIMNNTTGDGDKNDDGCAESATRRGGKGGGIYTEDTLNLENCIISHNRTGSGKDGGDGGGIYNSGGKARVENCFISDNTAGSHLKEGGNGGGIYNTGNLNISRSTITSNRVNLKSLACYVDPPPVKISGGGGIFNEGTLSLVNSTISYNSTSDYGKCGNSGSGGGIYNAQWANLENCTVSGNQTGNGGTCICEIPPGGNAGNGGGIYSEGTLTITACTICNNTTGMGGFLSYLPYVGEAGSGGGIYIESGNTSIRNTVIAGNRVDEQGTGPDCYGTIDSQGYNLVEDTGQCTIQGILSGNITGQDPLLDVLADNGGPTQTHALLPASPAIDAGDSFNLSQDQRGKPRPMDIADVANISDGADIGAYECFSSYTPPVYYEISGKITLNGTGLSGVVLTFSNGGGSTTTNNEGNYAKEVPAGWTGTVTPGKDNLTFNPSSREYESVDAHRDDQDYTALETVPPGIPEIALSSTRLNFSADLSGNRTGSQGFLIDNSGSGALNWRLDTDVDWVVCAPTAGSGPAAVTVSIDPAQLTAGTYTGTITVSDAGASNSPQTVNVTLHIYSSTTSPFGTFETPVHGSTIRSSIPVTGWVLDDIGVESVKIYRESGDSLVYIGDAVQVEGARPDIEAAYPDYPDNSGAGWGYMMLTNSLPNGGNGTFTFQVTAVDMEGHAAVLGKKTVTCDNAHAVKPFGALDAPEQGGIASGSAFVNFAWALTPLPNSIPTDGSTIRVWVDGVSLGNPVYNQYRKDIAELFPGYNNSQGAGGYFYLDTTAYANGIHTIQWTAADNAGNTDGIGSRYFTIRNTGEDQRCREQACLFRNSIPGIPVDCSQPLRMIKGYNANTEPTAVHPDDKGIIRIEMKELERLVIFLNNVPDKDSFITHHSSFRFSGYLPVGNQLKPLPIGSSLDSERGIFYWQPGAGFLGEYRFVFIREDENGDKYKNDIKITIVPLAGE